MARRLDVQFGGNTNGFEVALARARSMAGASTRSVAQDIQNRIIGAVSIGALTALSRSTMAYADDIEETSTRIGVSTDKLQEWGFAAKQSGADIHMLTRFVESLSDAASDPKKNKILQSLGINSKGMTPEQLFMAVNKFARGKSSTEVRDKLGDISNPRMLGSMMNLLQSDLEEVALAAREAGAVMEGDLVHQLGVLNDQFSIVSQILMTQFAPALLSVAKIALRTFGTGKGLVSEIGAKTAGLSPLQLAFIASPVGMLSAMRTMMNDKNQKSFNKTGEDLFAEAVGGIDEMLKKLENYKPPEPPKMSEHKDTETEMKSKLTELKLDELSKAGLFAVSSASIMGTTSVEEKTLQAVKDVAAATRETNRLLG